MNVLNVSSQTVVILNIYYKYDMWAYDMYRLRPRSSIWQS